MSETGIQADWRLRLGCAITHSNIDLILECSDRNEYYRIIRHARNMILVFLLTFLLWFYSLNGLLPVWQAAIFALIVAKIVYQLDLGFLTSDFERKGVLAEPLTFSLSTSGRIFSRLKTFLIRFGISIILALLTGTLVMLKLADGQIDEKLHAKRITYNTPILTEFETKLDLARQELFTPVLQERATELKARDAALERIRLSSLTVTQFEKEASQARQEMTREETGLNRKGGKGARYHDERTRMEEALRHTELNKQEIGQLKADVIRIESRIGAIDARLKDAKEAFSSRAATLIAARDAQIMPERGGIFLQYSTLLELLHDKELGTAIMFFSLLIEALFMILELSFFINMMNDIGSAYVTRARKIVEYEDLRATKEYSNAMAELEASATQANHSSEQNTAGNQNVSGVGRTAPLFDPADAESSGEECRDDLASASPSSRADDELYSIIGGTSDERATLAEALADRERYWVNQDRPEEIWLREYYAAIHGTTDNRAA